MSRLPTREEVVARVLAEVRARFADDGMREVAMYQFEMYWLPVYDLHRPWLESLGEDRRGGPSIPMSPEAGL